MSIKLSKFSPLEVVLEQKIDGESAGTLIFSARSTESNVFLKIRRLKSLRSELKNSLI